MATRRNSIPADPKAMGLPIFARSVDLLLPLGCLLLCLLCLLSVMGCGKDALRRREQPPRSWTCDPRADKAMRGENYPVAILLHEKFLEKHPENALALYHTGYAYGQQGDHRMEVSYYEKAVALGFRTGQIYFNLGMAYGDLHRTAEAISSFQKAVEADPRSADNYFGLAMAYQGIDRAYEFAEEAFLKAIEIDPGFVDARLHLSILYANTDQVERARDQLRKILEIDPNHREARELLRELGPE